MKKLLLVVVTILFGCAAPTPRIAETASGMPEILLSGKTSVSAVHDFILESMVSAGYRVDMDTASSLTMSRPMARSKEAGRRFAFGGQLGTFRDEVLFTIVKVSNGVKLFAQPAWSRSVNGQKIQEVKDGNEDFNQWQSNLLTLRKRAIFDGDRHSEP